MATVSMTKQSLQDSWQLLRRYPVRWLTLSIMLLILAELCMLIPLAGPALKLPVATLLSAQFCLLIHRSQHGNQPGFSDLLRGWEIRWQAAVTLSLLALISVITGLLFLALSGHSDSLQAFFAGPGKFSRIPLQDLLLFKLGAALAGTLMFYCLPLLALEKQAISLLLTRGFSELLRHPAPALLALALLSLPDGLLLLSARMQLGIPAWLLLIPGFFLLIWLPFFRYSSARNHGLLPSVS